MSEGDIEIWDTRESKAVLKYTEWHNFQRVIIKTKTACKKSNNNSPDHLVDVNKMVDIDFGTKRKTEDKS